MLYELPLAKASGHAYSEAAALAEHSVFNFSARL